MADYGIKIAKPGHDIHEPLTESTKKNFALLSTANSQKIVYAGFVEGGSYEHGFTYEPFCDVFEVDSVSSPSYFRGWNSHRITATHINGLPSKAYIIIYNEGGKD